MICNFNFVLMSGCVAKSKEIYMDELVNKILAKNANKNHRLVIDICKSHGLKAKHVHGNVFKIVEKYEWFFQAQNFAEKTRQLLLSCPELCIKKSSTYVYPNWLRYNISIVMFEVFYEDC